MRFVLSHHRHLDGLVAAHLHHVDAGGGHAVCLVAHLGLAHDEAACGQAVDDLSVICNYLFKTEFFNLFTGCFIN